MSEARVRRKEEVSEARVRRKEEVRRVRTGLERGKR